MTREIGSYKTHLPREMLHKYLEILLMLCEYVCD